MGSPWKKLCVNANARSSLVHRLFRGARAGLRQNFQRRGKNRRARGFRFPAEQKLRSRAANASLARSHAAARLQLGVAPGRIRLQARKFDVYAAADNCFESGDGAQFVAKSKRAAKNAGKMRGGSFLARELRGARGLPRSRIAGDLAFNDGGIHSADSGKFARAEYSLNR